MLNKVFESLFWRKYRTKLEGGNSEPFYQAASSSTLPHNVIYFSHDYFSSALHEIAHWCVAGAQRRCLDDYGYWYAPDGRSPEQQSDFERVEVVPQAMERIFARAAGEKFRVSADNLDGGVGASETFIINIHEQTLRFCRQGLPERANALAAGLAKAFKQPNPLNETHYLLEELL